MTKKIQEGASFNMNADNAQEMGAMLKTIMQLSGVKPVDNDMMPKTDLPMPTLINPSMSIKDKNDELGDIVKNAGLPSITTLPIVDGSEEENEAYANEPEPCTKEYDPNAHAGGLNGPKRQDFDVTPLGNNPMSKMAQHSESIDIIKARLIKEYKEYITEWDPSMYRSGDENDPRSPDYDKHEPDYWYGHGDREIEYIILPAPYDINTGNPEADLRKGQEAAFHVNASCDGEEFEITDIWYMPPEEDPIEISMEKAGKDWVIGVYDSAGEELQTDYEPPEDDRY